MEPVRGRLSAEITNDAGIDRLKISVLTTSANDEATIAAAERVVLQMPVIKNAMASGCLKITGFSTGYIPPVSTGMVKRTLTDTR